MFLICPYIQPTILGTGRNIESKKSGHDMMELQQSSNMHIHGCRWRKEKEKHIMGILIAHRFSPQNCTCVIVLINTNISSCNNKQISNYRVNEQETTCADVAAPFKDVMEWGWGWLISLRRWHSWLKMEWDFGDLYNLTDLLAWRKHRKNNSLSWFIRLEGSCIICMCLAEKVSKVPTSFYFWIL